MIFKQFISGKTITTQDLQKNVNLTLPSVTLCRRSGFKEKIDEYEDLEIADYLNNTLALEEILTDIKDPLKTGDDGWTTLNDIKKNDKHWKITTTYSMNRGRCYTIQYKQEVILSII